MLVFYLDRFAQDERFAVFAALADQYVFSLRISAGSLRRSTVENHFADRHVFADLLQCPSSLQAVALIEKLSAKQAQVLEQFDETDVKNAKKSPVIHRYINTFKSHYSAGKGAHAEHRSALATVLQNTFFQG
jgi:triphosphoribosyl-dephospho-CoA synthetase